MASRFANSATMTDLTKLASVLGIFGLFMDYRSEQRAQKWHTAGNEASSKQHRETIAVLKGILDELQKQRPSSTGSETNVS